MHGRPNHRIPVTVRKFLKPADDLVVVIGYLVFLFLEQSEHLENIGDDDIGPVLEMLDPGSLLAQFVKILFKQGIKGDIKGFSDPLEKIGQVVKGVGYRF